MLVLLESLDSGHSMHKIFFKMVLAILQHSYTSVCTKAMLLIRFLCLCLML